MRLNTNIAALTAYNALNHTGSQIEKTIQKLSTGLRINSASDDAAGLAISEKMRAQTRGMDVAVRNAQDGISLLQTAEGALASTNSILLRMRELSVQAANDTLTAGDRSFIQLEIDELKGEIDRIANTTQFNGKQLLDGSSGALWSSNKLSTKTLLQGGLKLIDRFGQKSSAEGNYNIEIIAESGQTQVQKSTIFKIKHRDVAMGAKLNKDAGAEDVRVSSVPAGNYTLTSEEPTEAHVMATGVYGLGLDELGESLSVHVGQSRLLNNASILFEVTHTDSEAKTVTLKVTANILRPDGITKNYTKEDIFLKEGEYNDLSVALGLGLPRSSEGSLNGAMEMKLEAGKTESFSVGDKFVYNLTVAKDVDGVDRTVKITNDQNMRSPESWQEVMEIQTSNSFERTTPPDVPARVIFIMDNSGSMDGVISEVKQRIKNFASEIKKQGVTDLQIGIATFWGDLDARTYPNGTLWSSDLNEIETLLNGVTCSGAIVDPYAAVTEALTAYDMSGVDAEGRHIVLITDTHDEVGGTSAVNLTDAQNALAGGEVNLSAVSNGDMDITQLITSEGMDMRLSSDWGTRLTAGLGKKIGEDVMKGLLFETTPLGDFKEFTTVGPDGRKLFTDATDTTEYTIQLEQNGVSHPITIGANDTLKNISEKLQAALGGGSSIEIVPVLSENKNGAKVISLQTRLSGGEGRVTYSGDPKMLAILGLRSNLEQKFSLNSSAIKNKDIHFRNFYLNSENGVVHEGDVSLTTNGNEMGLYKTLGTFEAAYVGQIARETTQLRDLEPFWNASGVCMLDNPQTLTINQGNGKSVSVTIYGNDTMNDLRSKLNDAIAHGLGQGRYVSGDTGHFVSFVDVDQTQNMDSETVGGTLLIRSVIPGREGELSFSGDEELLNALGLNTIQQSSESRYTAMIYDAHSGKRVASGIKVTGNHLNGVIHENVDVEFDAMSGVKATWNDDTKSYILSSRSAAMVVHLADNSTALQVGANKGEEFYLDIGNMSADALGITSVNVSTQERAEQAISMLDRAITRVLSQRAKIGAYQNSLEYTIEDLQTTATNLTAAESRIRDADMAKTMMEFVKLQILNQSGTSMLAQANQLPQQVLSLLQ